MTNSLKRCARCILPDNYPNIHFDDRGICNQCNNYEKKWRNYDWEARRKKLEDIFAKAKAKKRKYDCLVPVSGGKDSAYALYVCTQKYKLKALAINFNNGFASPVCSENLAVMARKFDCDFISWSLRWSVLKEAYRTFFLKTGDFCPPCSRAITAYTYRLAQKERIPLVVLGFNPKTDINPPEVEIIDQRLFKDVMKNHLTRKEKNNFVLFEPRRFLTKRINLPSYLQCTERDMVLELEQFLGSTGGFSGEMHFDCLVSPVANWLRRRKWGFDKKTQKYSALVRDRQMTREEAMKRAENADTENEPDILEYFMKMLDITREDIQAARDKSPLNFKHYNYQAGIIRLAKKMTDNDE